MSDPRVDRLETNCDKLNTQVQGISRRLERIEATQENFAVNVCAIHRVDIDKLSSSLDKVKEDINLLDKNQNNKWPSLIASLIGGAVTILAFLGLFFTLIMPAVRGAANG